MSRTLRLSLLALGFLLVARGASPQYFGQNKVQYRRFDFRILQTTHFDIYYYPAEQDAVYQAARMAEHWYEQLSRVLNHALHDRQPLVLYACHPDFSQTNVMEGSPGEGTGGFTESEKNRVVLPFGPSLAETSHVLGHELVHAFQYDMAKHGNPSIVTMPLWFIEGMAEYLSIGGMDAQTAMWMRDAVRQDKVPTVDQLGSPRYFPYRYGQAFWSYLAGRFGEAIVPALLRVKSEKVGKRLKAATGVDGAQLSKDWHAALRALYPAARPPEPKVAKARIDRDESGTRVRSVITARTAGRLNVGPALSPDGRELVFLSEKDAFSVDMFVADAMTGAIKRKIVSTATDPHFDSLQFTDSAGAWDPAGKRFAFTAIRGGGAVLVVVDTNTGRTEREARLGTIGQAFNPTWSPDGHRIAFSGLEGGASDLYVFDLQSGKLDGLTHDVFADVQPSWSPDGRTIAFVTDRFSTDLRRLEFGNYGLAALDVASRTITQMPGLKDGRNLDPHWSPDGHSLFFVGNAGTVSNIYRLDLASSRIAQVTDLWNGVSGVTPMSPVFSVAADRHQLTFSVYRNGGFEIEAIDGRNELAGQPVDAQRTTLPGLQSLVETPLQPLPLLDRPAVSLGDAAVREYRKRLTLSRIAQPYFSAGGGSFGTFVQAGMGFSFGDMLRDRQFDVAFQVGRRREDFAGQVAYINRESRLNYGFAADFMPALFAVSEATYVSGDNEVTRRTDYMRQIHTGARGLVFYPFNRSDRLEFGAGFERVSFARQTESDIFALGSGKMVQQQQSTARAADPITYMETSIALVRDTAVLGPTSPLVGTRYRFEVAPAMGGLSFTTVLADYRRYVMPLKPFTLAMRARYISRFGADASDPRLLPLVWTLRDQVRGYDLTSLLAGPCSTGTSAGCSTDLLGGTRLFVGNMELRFPLLGVFSRTWSYGPLPLEGFVYMDGGSLWAHHEVGPDQAWTRQMLRSVGAGVRVNAGGMVFEISAVRPYDRPDKRGWTVAFNLSPGF
ncbi:MAG: BamA/TamA family outer membrane protein [Bacteroidales bacterium]